MIDPYRRVRMLEVEVFRMRQELTRAQRALWAAAHQAGGELVIREPAMRAAVRDRERCLEFWMEMDGGTVRILAKCHGQT